MYFGINPEHKSKTLEMIGQDLNLTRERVRQIKNASLKKLEKHPDIHLLKQYL
jgi:RNA polymerase primary sigma factor